MTLSIIFCNGILVKRISTSRLAIKQLKSKLIIDLRNENHSGTVNLFLIEGDKIGKKSLAKLHKIILFVTKMHRNDGKFFVPGLFT